MRPLSFILVLVGLGLLCRAGHDQYRGITREPTWRAAVPGPEIVRQQKPKDFQNAMVFHWASGIVMVSAGVFLYRSIRREERLDPLSSDFDWKEEE